MQRCGRRNTPHLKSHSSYELLAGENRVVLKIYVDTGANLKPILHLKPEVSFIRFMHDKEDLITGHLQQATPSIPTWNDWTQTWETKGFSWEEMNPSAKLSEIEKILGTNARKDILHLDSAYKDGAIAFLTSDKKDIIQNRSNLEITLGFRIFLFSSKEETELDEFLDYIERKLD